MPQNALSAVRFQPADAALLEKWNEIVAKPSTRDQLVVRNGELLDRLEGTVGSLDAETLTFYVGDSAVPIPRNKPKLFGIVLAANPGNRPDPLCLLALKNGDRFGVGEISYRVGQLTVTLPTGGSFDLPIERIASIDFGREKVQFLSELEPRVREHKPFYDTSVFDVLIDINDDGGPISISDQEYRRGPGNPF